MTMINRAGDTLRQTKQALILKTEGECVLLLKRPEKASDGIKKLISRPKDVLCSSLQEELHNLNLLSITLTGYQAY